MKIQTAGHPSNEAVAETNRRDLLRLGSAALALPLLAVLDASADPYNDRIEGGVGPAGEDEFTAANDTGKSGDAMKVHYLEIVTPDVDAVCKTYAQLHGAEFGVPEASLGNARTAKLPGGGMLGVRAPLRPDEAPVVRPYFLVKDIAAAVAKAAESGAKIALPPMQLPGQGKCAIFIQGGVEHGLWQLEPAAG